MQGRTHLVVGTAAALAIFRPASLSLLVGGAAAAALGSVISDVDADQSGAGRDAARTLACAMILVVSVVFADAFFRLGIYGRFISRVDASRRIPAGLAFLLICAFGVLSRHRSFMHSLAAMLLLTVCASQISPQLAPFFLTGYLSHLALDLLNRRGLRLFFPFRRRFSIGLCRADGFVNGVLFWAGMAALVLTVYHGVT